MRKVFYFVATIALVSCGNDQPVQPQITAEDAFEEEEQIITVKQIKELKTASKVVYTLPSPVEMAELLHETNAVYDIEILNDPDGIDDYVTDVDRSLNLGVYFADLSFTSMFNYPQEAMKFMGAAQALSEELNIVGVFTEDVMIRLEENMSSKDSLMDIVASTYMDTDLYLQDNDRPIVAKAILGGAWIEGLYIAVNLKLDEGKENSIWKKIGEQKPALTNLINMLEDVNDPQFGPKLKELKELELVFDEVELNYESDSKSTTDEATKTTTIGGGLDVVISPETFQKIKDKTTAIRNGITN